MYLNEDYLLLKYLIEQKLEKYIIEEKNYLKIKFDPTIPFLFFGVII